MAALIVLILLGATVPNAATSADAATLTVEVNALQWNVLDPALNTQDAADAPIMNAIYGGLFVQGPNNSIVPSLATGYRYSDDHKLLKIFVRHGITFQDGSPLTAQVVAWNIKRDLTPRYACLCDSNFSVVTSVTSEGRYTVDLHLSHPDAALVAAFIGEAPDWIASEEAINKLGPTAFGQHPVGAGPFQVVSNYDSSQITMARFPKYWQKDKPHPARLKIQSVASDQTAYYAVKSKEAQAMIAATTSPVIQQALNDHAVTTQAVDSTTAYFLYFDLKSKPMQNLNLRKAVAYSVDAKALDRLAYAGKSPILQGVETPGQTYYTKKVKGYLGYNLPKAKALVAGLPDKNIDLITATNQSVWLQEGQAIQTELRDAGFSVSLRTDSISQSIADYSSHNFDVVLAIWSGFDPALLLPNYFSSVGAFSQVDDPTLTALEQQAEATANPSARARLYAHIYSYIDTHVYAVPLYVYPSWNVFNKGIKGITSYPINWANVSA